MDFKNILASLTTISEGETKETEKGRVHKGSYGTEYETDKEGNEKKKSKPETKKGRGRPKKDSDESGEVKKYDTKSLGDVFGGGKKPKKDVGTVSKKHSLKEYIEEVESNQQLDESQGVVGGDGQKLSVQQLATISDEALDKAYGYGRSTPGNTFGWQANLMSAAYAKKMIDAGVTDIEKISDAIHKGWNVTAQKFVQNPDQFDDTEKLRQAGKLEAKLQQRAKLMKINYAQLDNEEQEKDRVVARALLQAIKGQQGVAEAEQITIAPAQQNTQVIKQGDKTLGTVNNPQLAATIKQAIGKGQMTLAGGELGEESLDQPGTMEQANGEGAIRMQGQKVTEKAPKGWEGTVKAMKKHKDDIDNPWALAHWMKNKGYKSHKKEDMAESTFTLQSGRILTEDQKDSLIKFFHELENGPRGFNIGAAVELKDRKMAENVIRNVLKHGRFKTMSGTYKADLMDAALEHFGFTSYEESLEEADILPGHSDSIRQHTQHALAEPTSSFQSKDDPRMAVPRGTPTKFNRPVQNPTPWGTDPIAASGERVGNFLSSLGKGTKFTKEGTEMKDIQLEGWENQLNNLLTEGITVSSSQGQQGAPDSVSITATDNDAQSLMSVLRNAGIGGFGAEEKAPEIGYGVAQGGEEEPTGTGTEPQAAPEVVGDGDDMLALIKKLTGMGSEEGSADYADEEGQDQTLEPADEEECPHCHESPCACDDEEDSGEEDEGEEEEQTDEGNDFTEKLKKTPKGEKFTIGGKEYTDTSNLEEDDMDEGAGVMHYKAQQAKADGEKSFKLGDKEFPVKEEEHMHEGEEQCNECGMYESECGCDHESVEESFANDAGGNAMGDTELAKLKALLSMGGDLHKMKHSQAVGNPIRVAEALNDWKKLSGIK